MADFTFGTFEEPTKVNPYAELAQAFVAGYAANPLISYTLTVPAEKALTERNRFGAAVNDAGMTARKRSETEEIVKGKPTGNVKILFTLTKRHKGRRVAK